MNQKIQFAVLSLGLIALTGCTSDLRQEPLSLKGQFSSEAGALEMLIQPDTVFSFDWLPLAGLDTILFAEVPDDSVTSSSVVISYDLDQDFDLSESLLSYHFLDGTLSYIFRPLTEVDNYLILTDRDGVVSGFLVYWDQIDDWTVFRQLSLDTEVFADYLISDDGELFLPPINDPVQIPNSNPNCDDLGPIQNGESFNDCFARNWSNFCCDFVGCVSQIFNPVPVAIGISISCAL